MTAVVRHDRHRHGFPDGDTASLLDLPEAQPIIRRLGENIDPDYPHRMEHVLRVAAIVMAAKRNPANSYAQATL